RDLIVTGVQTCALPIWRLATELPGVILVERGEVELADEINQEKDQVVFGQCVPRRDRIVAVLLSIPGTVSLAVAIHDRAPRSHRSEERRVGKDSRRREW